MALAARQMARLRLPALLLAVCGLLPPAAALGAAQVRHTKGAHAGKEFHDFLAPEAALGQLHEAARAPPVTTRTTTSWFQQMSDSMVQFVIGIVLIVFSLPVLWANESRNARMETLLSYAASQVRTVGGKRAEPDNRDWLVHVQGEPMRAAAATTDPRFDVTMASGCVRLRSDVEVFQVIEHTHTEERDKLGGGKEKITIYTYTKEWSSGWNDSSGYQDVSQRVNTKPDGMGLGSCTQECSRVEYGGCFLLPQALVAQCEAFQSASGALGESISLKDGGAAFRKQADGRFYCARAGSAYGSPAVGDARVSFAYVPDGPVTLIALQAAAKDGGDRDSFLPYRLISRGWCGVSEAEEKRRLRWEGEKSTDQLASEAGCPGILGCLCCACNLVARCCAAVLTPEVHHLFDGSLDARACLEVISSRGRALTWCCRLAGWLMMFVGFYSLFSPFLTLIQVLPFIGPFLSQLAGGLIWFLCLVSTILLASLVIIVAYLLFHPLTALLYSVFASVVVGGLFALVSLVH